MKQFFKDYGIAIFSALFLALLVRNFFIEAFRIPTAVMKPTLLPGELIFVSKLHYGVRIPFLDTRITQGEPPQYGDVVIYNPKSAPGQSYIKRIIALPGDTLAIRNNQIILNEHPLEFQVGADGVCGKEIHPRVDSPYGICWTPPTLFDAEAVRIPEGSVFVVGDLRSRTSSRRPTEMIPISSITGKARWVWFSVADRSDWGAKLRFNRFFKEIK